MTRPTGADGTQADLPGEVGAGRVEAAMDRLQRLLNFQVSIGALLEFALWIAIPYLAIGLMWAFVHAGEVKQLQTRLERVLPAGADVAALGVTAAVWPASLPIANACPTP